MTDELDDILDSIFHGCAVAAWLDQAAEDGQWPPDSEATRQRAYRCYEEELARRTRRRAHNGSDGKGTGRNAAPAPITFAVIAFPG